MKNIIFTIIVLFSCFTQVHAQKETTISHKKIPSLGDHTFLTSSQHRSPFITTNLETNIGFGSTSLINIPGIEIGDHEIFKFQGKIIYVDVNLQYQQKITSWLALFATMKIASRMGGDMSTILADGINTISGGDIGWLIKLKHTEKLILSGTVKATNISGSFINLKDYLEDVINDEPYPSLSKKIPATTIGLGLRGAYAFNPTYGLQFNARLAHGESLARGTSDTYYSVGVLGDLNFKPKHDVPVALALGYTISSTPEISMNDRGSSNLFLGKVGYTGSDDYEIGLQYTYYNVNLKSVESSTSISKIMLGLKFYF